MGSWPHLNQTGSSHNNPSHNNLSRDNLTAHRVVALMEVLPEDEIMLITKSGVVIRSEVKHVRITGRNAQGVRLVQLDEGDMVRAVARVVPEEKGEVDGEPEGSAEAAPEVEEE